MDSSSPPLSEAFVLQECLARANLHATWRSKATVPWNQILAEVAYVPVAYTEEMMDYQHAYVRGAGVQLQDLSLILLHDNQPAGVWPLCLRKREVLELGSNEGPVLPPLFDRRLAPTSVKNLTTQCLNFLDAVGQMTAISVWRGIEPFAAVHALNDWHCQALRRGAEAAVRHSLFVNLKMELPAIKACFRKSYKALINSGSRLWQIGVLREAGENDAAVWTEFRELHCQVAGRLTRPLETWEAQLHAIRQRAAFLVYLRDGQQRMVGGGFFQLSRDEGVYAVAAYDRELFDKPLGHVVQYHAIQEMQQRALAWYCIGPRFYPADQPLPSPKELAIAEFKEGFATHYFPTYLLSAAIAPPSAPTVAGE
jgi:FemAB family protein